MLMASVIWLFSTTICLADSYLIGGLEFSDELGGFRLLGVSGQGSKIDPFVIMEEIYTAQSVALTIKGFHDMQKGDNQVKVVGLYIRKIVRNATDRSWFTFDMELRENIKFPSDYWDGLSFNQAGVSITPFISDKFTLSQQQQEPFDAISFKNGRVKPGDTVFFDIIISDLTPVDEFFLMQTSVGPSSNMDGDMPNQLLAALPPDMVFTEF